MVPTRSLRPALRPSSPFRRMALLAAASAMLVACSHDPAGSGGSTDPGTGGRATTGGSGGAKATGGATGSGSGGSGSGGSAAGGAGPAPGTGGAQASGGQSGGTGGGGPAEDAAPAPVDGSGEAAPPATPPGSPGTSPTMEPGPEGPVYTAPMAPPGNSPLTAGWTQMPFKYRVHSPRNLPPAERITHDAATNTYTTWVKSDDQPFQAGNNTDPRTEMRWVTTYPKGGEHMFDADVWIEPKTNRTNIMQVFMTTPRPTSLMITAWDDGNLRTYFGGGPVLKPMANGVWWNLKTRHDTRAGMIHVYGDDKLLGTFPDRGGSNWYFKNGVYGSRGRSETRWRNIRYWVKP